MKALFKKLTVLLFTSMWVQLLLAVLFVFLTLYKDVVGVIFFVLYFVVWCNEMYNVWLEKERAKMKK